MYATVERETVRRPQNPAYHRLRRDTRSRPVETSIHRCAPDPLALRERVARFSERGEVARWSGPLREADRDSTARFFRQRFRLRPRVCSPHALALGGETTITAAMINGRAFSEPPDPSTTPSQEPRPTLGSITESLARERTLRHPASRAGVELQFAAIGLVGHGTAGSVLETGHDLTCGAGIVPATTKPARPGAAGRLHTELPGA